MLARRIEEAALNAWPALQQVLYDGWILRFSRGYSKRANSVTPLFESSLDLREKIAICERTYRAKALPPIFRLTPFAAPAELEPLLEQRGYELVEPSLVLQRAFGQHLPAVGGAAPREEGLDEWLRIYAGLSRLDAAHQPTLRAMLEAIPTRRFLAALLEAGSAVACGMGVLEGDLFGMFDLVVESSQRNRGYGTKLVCGMLDWAQANGARHAYLQVVGSNAPARQLYAKLGFQDLYPYHYRVLRTR